MLKVGIVGLPNVGKSTLFNTLLKKQVADVANYPFCTIEPNVGIIEVPDERLNVLAKLVTAQKIVPAAIEFYDIAGLVKGASEGEGLGNKFLSHIRETALIVHVVRLFENGEIMHVADTVDPIRDIATIDTELVLSDLSTLEKQREPKGAAKKEDIATWEAIQFAKKEMDKGIPARKIALSEAQKESLRQFNLITMKPVLYVFNLSEQQLEKSDEMRVKMREIVEKIEGGVVNDDGYLGLCVKLESDLVSLSDEDQVEYREQYGLSDSGLSRLIKTAYAHLGLISYLTCGEIEARAWTIPTGTKAPQAAGVIHTDFEKHFIKADVVPYQIFVDAGGWSKAREMGKVVLAGKEYTMLDGDVVEFKVGV